MLNGEGLYNEKRILRIITMISIPLSYIHSQNIVHRDLKPHNILVDNLNGKEIFLLTDFGVSQQKGISFITTVSDKMTRLYASIE